MFIDKITLFASAGNGGDGVVRWRHEKFVPNAGPAGGNGGDGGDVYVEAVRDLGLLAKYQSNPVFKAGIGDAGARGSKDGKHGKDITIYVPVGSLVTDTARNRRYEFFTEGHRERIFVGGRGGRGNEHYKSSTNRSPEQSTKGQPGESGELLVELTLVVDVGLIGEPNAGKSSILNTLTNAQSRVGDYPFTTLVPHLGDFYGFTIADIPGLIEGAADGKGLGYTFLRHVSKTKMLLHVIPLTSSDITKTYQTIFHELYSFDKTLVEKDTWIILTKSDLVKQEDIDAASKALEVFEKRVFVISTNTGFGVETLRSALVQALQTT